MKKHYYSAVYENGSARLLDVICYHSDSEEDQSLVRECRNAEAAPWYWSGVHMRKVSPREALSLARQLLGIRKHERLPHGYKVAFTNYHTMSDCVFASSFELVRG